MKRNRDYGSGVEVDPSEKRGWKVIHQSVVVTQISLRSKSLMAFVDLRIRPVDKNLKCIRLNARQLKIYWVRCDNIVCNFVYVDPSSKLARADYPNKNHTYIQHCFESAVAESDPDRSQGELKIDLPAEIQDRIRADPENPPTLSITVEYTLEKPRGGLQFIPGTNAHCYSYGESRLWFPCVDTNTEVCTWTLDFTVDANLTAVSCGELVETVLSEDSKAKTFRYKLLVPTSAPNIGIAIGNFEIHVDRAMPEMTQFSIPGLIDPLVFSTSTTYQIIEYFEDLLSARFPYALYKQVFVEKLPDKFKSFSSMTLFDTSLLYNERVLDQILVTRKIVARAIAGQFFGCFMVAGNDGSWLPAAIAGYLTSLWLRKTFGNSEYRYFIYEETNKVCTYEEKEQAIILSQAHTNFTTRHAKMVGKKGHLVLRILENRLSTSLLLQAVNKLLAISRDSYSRQDGKIHLNKAGKFERSPQIISSISFLKFVASVTEKDVKDLLDLWVRRGGVAHINASFSFHRNKNAIEIEIRQDRSGAVRYVGPMTVRIQELDGTFNHTIQVEDKTNKISINCHSRARRNKRKKIPLLNGEEVDIDLSQSDQDSPVLWIRLDPDCNLIRTIHLRQPDYCLQYLIKYEREVIGQLEGIQHLTDYPTENTIKALKETVEGLEFFWRVRVLACQTLSKVANLMPDPDSGKDALLTVFKAYFCLSDTVSKERLVRRNDFSNFQQYFVQCAIPIGLSKIRMSSGMTPAGVFKFIESLIKHNDNSKNAYLDCYWKGKLIDALSNTLCRAVVAQKLSAVSDEAKSVIEEVMRIFNTEWLLPSYRHVTFISAMNAVRTLQRQQHIPPASELFRRFSEPGQYSCVRVAAITCLVDFIKTEKSGGLEDLKRLFKIASVDPEAKIRYKTIRLLMKTPPFKRGDLNNKLNCPIVRQQLWQLISEDSACDTRVRAGGMQLWKILFGDVEFDRDNGLLANGQGSDDDSGKRKKKKKKKEKKHKKDKEKQKDEKPAIVGLSDDVQLNWF